MRIGFLILAHRNPGQLVKLVNMLLKDEHSSVFIHVDLKSEMVYQEVSSFFSTNSRVILAKKRYRVYWGSYNQVLATVELLREAAHSGTHRNCLISGQDLPTRSAEAINVFFKKNFSTEFLVNFPLPDAQWEGGGLKRMERYYLNFNSLFLTGKINRLISIFQSVTGFKRDIPSHLYGGSNWFNLTDAATRYVISYLASNPGYLRSFRFTRCADEIFIQSILMNSPLREHVVSDDLRFVDWSTGPEYPRILRKEDLKRIQTNEKKLFARKFDENTDNDIINALTAENAG